MKKTLNIILKNNNKEKLMKKMLKDIKSKINHNKVIIS